jgi:hypothetical protein
MLSTGGYEQLAQTFGALLGWIEANGYIIALPIIRAQLEIRTLLGFSMKGCSEAGGTIQQALDAHFQFAHLEGLRDVVIGALTKAGDNIVWRPIGGHDNNRDAAALTYFGAHRMTIPIGQLEIQQHEIDLPLVKDR